MEEPLDGELKILVFPNKNGATWFGANPTVSAQVIPLNNQKIASAPIIATTDNIHVEGKAAKTQSNVITQNKIPSGDYLLRIRVAGERNWDRKTVFVRVK